MPRRSLSRWSGLAVLALCASQALRAQEVPQGRIEGEVEDSMHARKLAGAVVMVTRLTPEPARFFSAVTDARGRFRFDSMTAGRYYITFTDSKLDSLDIMLPPRELVLAEGERVRVNMATPSRATLRDAACPRLKLPAGTGAVIGEVIDADTERPLVGARVVVAWTDMSFDRETLRAITTPRAGYATTDSLGLYRLCGVPTSTRLVVQLQTETVVGAGIELFVDDSVGVARRTLSLSGVEATRIADLAAAKSGDSLPPQARTGTAALAGTVRSQGGAPLPGARVHVIDAVSDALTDSAGHFELFHLPAGSQVVEVRKLGYTLAHAQAELRRAHTTQLEVQLTHFVSLDSIRILARRSLYRAFEDDRRHGGWAWGTFMDEEQVAKRAAFYTTDLFRTVPGLLVIGGGGTSSVVSSRGVTSLAGGFCKLNVVIDGVQHLDINMVSPQEIGAVEVYPSSVGVPIQYTSGSPCGAIIIWTKRR